MCNVTCLVKVPDVKNFKTPQLILVEEMMNTFYPDSVIEWEVMDAGARQAFKIYNYALCDEITGIRNFTLIHDIHPFKFIQPEGMNWYITFHNEYIGCDDPATGVQAMLNHLISEKQREIEQLIGKKHLPERNQPVLE